MIRIFLLAALVGLVSAQDNTSTTDEPASGGIAVPSAGPVFATGEFVVAGASGSKFPDCNNTVLATTQTYDDMKDFCNQALINSTDITNAATPLTCMPRMACTGTSYKVTYRTVATNGNKAAQNAATDDVARTANDPAQMKTNFQSAAAALGWTVGAISGATRPVKQSDGATANIGTTNFKCTATQMTAATGCSGPLATPVPPQDIIPYTLANRNCVTLSGTGITQGLVVNGWLVNQATSVLTATTCGGAVSTFDNVPVTGEYTSSPVCIPQANLGALTNDVFLECVAVATTTTTTAAPDSSAGTTSSAITAGLSVVVGMFVILFM